MKQSSWMNEWTTLYINRCIYTKYNEKNRIAYCLSYTNRHADKQNSLLQKKSMELEMDKTT